MVYIQRIKMAPQGSRHEHIVEVEWKDPADGQMGKSSVATMVDYIDNKNGDVKVTDGKTTVEVQTVPARPKYIQTKANGKLTDNLLSLPRY